MTLLRASASHRWMNCSLSIEPDVNDLPDVEGDEAREGTCAAWVAEMVLNGDAASAEDYLGETHTNGWQVDEDMVRHVQGYIDWIMSNGIVGRAEVFRQAQYGQTMLAGTCDFDGEWGMTHNPIIVDLKYGYDPVNVYENWQLLSYAFLRSIEYGMPVEKITLVIYQPRAMHPDGPVRIWKPTTAELEPYFTKIYNRVLAIDAGHVDAPAGSHCKHCLKAVNCASLTQTVYQMFQPLDVRAVQVPTGQQLADELTLVHRMEDLLKARKTAVEAEAEARINRAELVPGYAFVDKVGKRQFSMSREQIKGLTGIDPVDEKLITPAELQRRGKLKESTIKLISRTPTVGRTLRRVTPDDIAKRFKNG